MHLQHISGHHLYWEPVQCALLSLQKGRSPFSYPPVDTQVLPQPWEEKGNDSDKVNKGLWFNFSPRSQISS